MKDEKQKRSTAKPLLKGLVDRKKNNSRIEKPSIGSKPLKSDALYQDPGGGYNPDFTFPQE
ncbi:MAG TPA: hypothetical protein VF283_02550 [Bryobacteraceae bacterium]